MGRLADRGVHLCAVMGRAADQRARPDDVAGHREREVVLPEVQHVGARGASDVGPVVDGQQGPVAAGRVGQYFQRGQLGAGLQRAEALLTDGALVPQLDDVDPAGQRGVDERGEVTALATRIGAQVQAGLGEAGPWGLGGYGTSATLASGWRRGVTWTPEHGSPGTGD